MEGFDVDGEGARHGYAIGLLPKLRANTDGGPSSIGLASRMEQQNQHPHQIISQLQGSRKLSPFQKGKTSILIASDRASRGLDISNLARVINHDMPPSLTSYVHRIVLAAV